MNRDPAVLTWVPILAAVLLVLAQLAVPRATGSAALTIAVVGALLGVPHGAVDHLTALPPGATLAGRGRVVARFATRYTLGAALAAVALYLVPTVMILLFLILSAVHFGRGEVVTADRRAGVALDARVGAAVALAHGLVVVGLLVWAAPSQTGPYLVQLSPLVAVVAADTRGPGIALCLVVSLAAVVLLVRHHRRLDACELVLLLVLFATAPPLAAFGVYFGAWHSVRHVGRLLDLVGDATCTRAQAAWQLARKGALPTVAAFGAVAVLWSLRGVAGLTAEVAVLLALTFPHSFVVARLDRSDRPPVA